jgi:TctA family transporter
MLETLSLMGAGFVHALSPINLFAMFVSTAFGVAIGCLPGLSAAMGVALLLPVTFGMDPVAAVINSIYRAFFIIACTGFSKIELSQTSFSFY